jgi:hypothetical protein
LQQTDQKDTGGFYQKTQKTVNGPKGDSAASELLGQEALEEGVGRAARFGEGVG